MHPAGLEEAAGVVAHGEGGAVLVEHHHRAGRFGEFQHVVAQSGHAGGDGGLVVGRIGGAGVQGLVVAVALQLAAPDSSEVEIVFSVIFQHADIYRIAAYHRGRLGDEGAFGLVGHCDSEAEDVGFVLGGEVQVVFAVLAGHVAVPELAARPGDVLQAQCHSVILHGGSHRIGAFQREHVVVLHVEVAAEIILRNTGFPVVGGIDIEFAVEDVHRRVGHVVLGDQIPFLYFICHRYIRVRMVSVCSCGRTIRGCRACRGWASCSSSCRRRRLPRRSRA